jgi:hypothetical protein
MKRLWSLSSLLSHMRCRAKKRVRKARGAADIVNIGKPSNAADAPFGSNPKGRERFGHGSALVRPRNSGTIASGSRLEPRPNRPPSHARK